MSKKKYILEEQDFENVDRELLKVFDEQLILMERLYGVADHSEMRTQKLREKALLLQIKLRRLGAKLSPFFFEERRSYLLRKQKYRLR